MAEVKISDMVSATQLSSTDVMPVVSSATTKKVALSVISGNVKNVLFYGAKGDGSTDDTAAIQSALNDGGTVYIPYTGSNYIISDRLLIYSNTHLIIAPNATIYLASGSNVCMLRNANMTSDIDNPVNTNITIEGGIFDGNYANNAATQSNSDKTGAMTGVHGLLSFIGVKDLVLRGVTVKNAQGFAIQILGTYWRAYNTRFDTHRDGFHIDTGNHFVISGVYGQSDDDFIAINAWDWNYSTPLQGPITDGLIENVLGESNTSIIKLLAGGENSSSIKRVHIQNIVSPSSTKKCLISLDANSGDQIDPSHTLGGLGIIDDVTIDNISSNKSIKIALGNAIENLKIKNVTLPASQGYDDFIYQYATNLGGVSGCYTKNLIVENITTPNSQTSSNLYKLIHVYGTIDNLLIDNLHLYSLGSSSAKFLQVESGGLVKRAVYSKFYCDWSGASPPLNLVSGGTINTLKLIDLHLNGVSTSAVPFINVGGGTLNQLIINNPEVLSAGAFYRQMSTSPVCTVLCNGGHFYNVRHSFWVQATTNLTLQGVNFDTISGIAVHCDSPTSTATVRSSNCQFSGTGVVLAKTNGTVRWIGFDLTVDLTLLTPSQWDVARSTTETGPAIYDGAAWQKWGHA